MAATRSSVKKAPAKSRAEAKSLHEKFVSRLAATKSTATTTRSAATREPIIESAATRTSREVSVIAAAEPTAAIATSAPSPDEATPSGKLTRAAKSKAQSTLDSYRENDTSDDEDDEVDRYETLSDAMEVAQPSNVPGFNFWKTGTRLASGQELTELPQVCAFRTLLSTRGAN